MKCCDILMNTFHSTLCSAASSCFHAVPASTRVGNWSWSGLRVGSLCCPLLLKREIKSIFSLNTSTTGSLAVRSCCRKQFYLKSLKSQNDNKYAGLSGCIPHKTKSMHKKCLFQVFFIQTHFTNLSLNWRSYHFCMWVQCFIKLPPTTRTKAEAIHLCKVRFYLFRFIEAFLENILISRPVKSDSTGAQTNEWLGRGEGGGCKHSQKNKTKNIRTNNS